ncbi:MAG TPA: shikimate kinase [Acidobacteriota bacterium]
MLTSLREPNYYLLGFMGAGKSTVGPLLAGRLDTQFYDLDQLIEETEKSTIRQIFETRGEAFFRKKETELLLPLTRLRSAVIALGGGTFVQEINRELIRSTGISIWINVPLERIQKRIQNPLSRPLFRTPQEMEALFRQREAFYAMADLEVRVGEEPVEDVADKILSSITNFHELTQIPRSNEDS